MFHQRWFIFERKGKPITISCKVQWLGVCSATAKAAKVLPLKSAPSGLLHAGEGVRAQAVPTPSLIVPNKPIQLGFLQASELRSRCLEFFVLFFLFFFSSFFRPCRGCHHGGAESGVTDTHHEVSEENTGHKKIASRTPTKPQWMKYIPS